MTAKALFRSFERLREADEKSPLLDDSQVASMGIPIPTFMFAKNDASGKKVPQAIAHRGYKAVHPENTMGAFKGAVEVGAHAIETDIHLTKDGVVVLSHDATLKRCFGHDEKIIDHDWSYISTLRTLKEPHEPMPRLCDLLQYLATPGLENIWLLLDIKLDNNDDDVMRLIASTIASVEPSKPWNSRIILGCWALRYVHLCNEYLPGFPITHIGFSTSYARQFLKIPHVSFNMLQKTMIGPYGARFLKDCKRQKRAVYLWTVNDEKWMRWCIRKEVDGVLTDDPDKYLRVVKDLETEDGKGWKEADAEDRVSLQEWMRVMWIWILVLIFGTLFRYRYGKKAPPSSHKPAVDVKSRTKITA